MADEQEAAGSNAGALYIGIMEEVQLRLASIDHALRWIRRNADEPSAFLRAEFCYLQLRLICELIALAVLSAHKEVTAANSRDFLRKWNADQIFDKLEAINPHCYPQPIRAQRRASDGQLHFSASNRRHLDRSALKRIYHRCGENLHRGMLEQLYAGARKTYDLGEIAASISNIRALLDQHMVLLPDLNAVLLVQMNGPDGTVQWHYAVSDDGEPFVVVNP